MENRVPWCGKVGETCFHCVENFPKQVSIVWKNHRNTLPLRGKPAAAGFLARKKGRGNDEATKRRESGGLWRGEGAAWA